MKFIYVLFMLFFFSFPVSAEYYRYTDKEGIVNFTDNLADVPMAQRKEGNRLEEISDSVNLEEGQKKEQVTLKEAANKQIINSKQQTTTTGGGEATKESEILSQIHILNKEKQSLDKAYEQLVTKKQSLKKEKASLSTSEEIKAYQNNIKMLNQVISDFENRRKKFEKKAKEFNAKAAQ